MVRDPDGGSRRHVFGDLPDDAGDLTVDICISRLVFGYVAGFARARSDFSVTKPYRYCWLLRLIVYPELKDVGLAAPALFCTAGAVVCAVSVAGSELHAARPAAAPTRASVAPASRERRRAGRALRRGVVMGTPKVGAR